MVSRSKILGCLVGAAAGDAMGAATEIRNRAQIHELFGGDVRDFYKPPKDTFARGSEAGQITDDFSVSYVTAQHIVRNGGKITPEIAEEALLEWSTIERWFSRFAGPTTRANLARIKNAKAGIEPPADEFVPVNYNSQSSNGAGMKIPAPSLFSDGDIDKAIENAITICHITHPNQIALAGATAVAAAVAAASKEGADLFDVVKAGIYGAEKGQELGSRYHTNAGANIAKRIKLAVSIAMTADSYDAAIDEIADVIGSSLAAQEAIPAVFGLMVAAGGDTVDGICAGVNVGDDTDTVATMIGGILGTLNGIESMPESWLDYLNRQNEIELDKLADEMAAVINK